MDTAQLSGAAETVDPIAAGATAFKIALGQEEAPPLPERDDAGRFKAAEPQEQEPEPAPEMAEDDEETGEVEQPEAESEEGEEEAQQDAAPMPASWSKEDEQLWSELPATAQAKIAEREAQRDQAVNQKFQEAANVRKSFETEAQAAQQSRAEFIQAVDQIVGLILPQEPPLAMLDATSGDYDPDGYHLLKAQYDRSLHIAGTLSQQRQQAAAQYEQETTRLQGERLQHLNQQSAPALFKEVPDLADQAKAPEVLRGLIDYAVSLGAPPETFQQPTSALEWHVLWKAKEYDRLQQAKGAVKAAPPPPKKAQPPVRPGVTTPRSSVQRAQQQKDFARLSQSGSIEDGAAVFKHFMKGS